MPEVRHEGYAVLADRIHRYKLPLALLYAALTENRAAWLRLQPGEITPEVVEAIPLQRVIWSSFWPVSADDIIELDLSSSRQEHREPTRGRQVHERQSVLRMRWLSRTPPDERGIGITRQRLNRKFGSDLRAVVSEYFWTGHL